MKKPHLITNSIVSIFSYYLFTVWIWNSVFLAFIRAKISIGLRQSIDSGCVQTGVELYLYSRYIILVCIFAYVCWDLIYELRYSVCASEFSEVFYVSFINAVQPYNLSSCFNQCSKIFCWMATWVFSNNLKWSKFSFLVQIVTLLLHIQLHSNVVFAEQHKIVWITYYQPIETAYSFLGIIFSLEFVDNRKICRGTTLVTCQTKKPVPIDGYNSISSKWTKFVISKDGPKCIGENWIMYERK